MIKNLETVAGIALNKVMAYNIYSLAFFQGSTEIWPGCNPAMQLDCWNLKSEFSVI